MVKPIVLTSEQRALIEEINALDRRFAADPNLHHSLSAIETAKSMIGRGLDAGLEQQFVHPLQIWVGQHETEQGLPEHLREWHPTP